jgi:hypothetical protein
MAFCSIQYTEHDVPGFYGRLDVRVNLTDFYLGREGLTPEDGFGPDLGGCDITDRISHADRRVLFECTRGLRLGFVAEPSMGCDGTDYELTIRFSPACSIRCQWWNELPTEWKDMEPLVRILRKGGFYSVFTDS